MITHRTERTARVALRAFIASVFAGLVSVAAVASADTPAAWDDAPEHGAFGYLLLLFLIPLGIALVVTTLVLLPSMIRGEKHEEGDAWRSDDEWFGGPRQGIEAKDHAEIGADRGGASGNW